MARPNFTVSLRGSFVRTTYPNGLVYPGTGVAQSATESASGIKRRKPTGWLEPTGYSFNRTAHFTEEGRLISEIDEGPTWGGRRISQVITGNVFSADTGSGPFYGCNFIPVPTVTDAMRDQALIKARLQMKDQSVNLGVAFAERKRTANLLASTAGQLVSSMRNLRKGNFKGAARSLGLNNPRKPRGNSVPARWLELQYGWMPLLNDVYGSAEALAKSQRSDWRITGKGTVFQDIYEEATTPDGPGYQAGGRVKMIGKKGVFVRIDAIPQNELLQSAAALGLTNPAEIAWELVPFSFVVDWALPIGNFISSLDAMLGYGPTSCSISSLVKVDSYFTCKRHWNNLETRNRYPYSFSTKEGKSRREIVRFSRAVSSSVPLPSLPRLRDPVSLNRMANALALLTQVFGGRR